MKKSRIKATALAVAIMIGLLGSTAVYAAGTDDAGYLDAWNDIHGLDASGNDSGLSVEEREVKLPVTEETAESEGAENATTYDREVSVTEDSGEIVGDYISSDVTIGQTGTPDLNIDFSMSGGDSGNTGLFTPDGNLTLVDDLDSQESASLQFMTVQTKNGTTFYIIIDRTANKENVYFLNPVDAADLMALMDDDTKAKFQTDTEAQAKSNMQSTETTEKIGDTDSQKDEKAEKKENSTNPLGTLLIFVILGGGGAAAYYFFKIKPQKAQMKNDDDDLEFQDDEEYDMEHPEPDVDGENTPNPDNGVNDETDDDSEEDY